MPIYLHNKRLKNEWLGHCTRLY